MLVDQQVASFLNLLSSLLVLLLAMALEMCFQTRLRQSHLRLVLENRIPPTLHQILLKVR
jgi:hypothetical protein